MAEKKSILEELIEYANSCIDGELAKRSGLKHKWACTRFLNDLKRSEAATEKFPYAWEEQEAQNIYDWFLLLRHSKGILAGKPIQLTTAQKFTVCQLYGWRHRDTGFKRFTKSFKEVARKNAKSQEEAGIVLYEIAVQATKNREIYETYCAGTKKDQSKLVYEECINMLRGSPLRKKFKIANGVILHIKSHSYLKPLCKEDGRKGDGTNPAVLILDEYHQHPTTEFYDLGIGANTKESLLMIITTAGTNLNAPCYVEEYQYCSNILNPDVDIHNDTYLVDIMEIDAEDDPFDMENWYKANPVRMSYPEGIKKIQDTFDVAKDVPEKMTAFITKCLNVWVQKQNNSYMDMSKWKACEIREISMEELRGQEVFVGFDMSAKIDLTSVSFVIPIYKLIEGAKRKVYVVFSHSFAPSEIKLRERKQRDKAPYDAWARNEFITVTNTEIVDQQQVMDYVFETCKKNQWNINTLCFDPANAGKLMMDISNEGYVVEEVFQSHKSLNESTAGFREQVYMGNVIYQYNPVLNFAMNNTVIRQNNGLIKIDKDATEKKIDPVDAVLCAFKLALYFEPYSKVNVDKWLAEETW